MARVARLHPGLSPASGAERSWHTPRRFDQQFLAHALGRIAQPFRAACPAARRRRCLWMCRLGSIGSAIPACARWVRVPVVASGYTPPGTPASVLASARLGACGYSLSPFTPLGSTDSSAIAATIAGTFSRFLLRSRSTYTRRIDWAWLAFRDRRYEPGVELRQPLYDVRTRHDAERFIVMVSSGMGE